MARQVASPEANPHSCLSDACTDELGGRPSRDAGRGSGDECWLSWCRWWRGEWRGRKEHLRVWTLGTHRSLEEVPDHPCLLSESRRPVSQCQPALCPDTAPAEYDEREKGGTRKLRCKWVGKQQLKRKPNCSSCSSPVPSLLRPDQRQRSTWRKRTW